MPILAAGECLISPHGPPHIRAGNEPKRRLKFHNHGVIVKLQTSKVIVKLQTSRSFVCSSTQPIPCLHLVTQTAASSQQPFSTTLNNPWKGGGSQAVNLGAGLGQGIFPQKMQKYVKVLSIISPQELVITTPQLTMTI